MRQVIIAMSLTALAACMPAAAPTGGADELVMYANGEATSLKMEGDRAWGPNAELKRFDGAYRGTFNGRIVDLHMEGDRLFGTIGASKVDLHVSGDGAQVHGQGLLNGHISTFDVDDTTLVGTFGDCSYEMKRREPTAAPEGQAAPTAATETKYFGSQSCNGALYPASHVTIPDYYRTLSALDQATLYTILLVG